MPERTEIYGARAHPVPSVGLLVKKRGKGERREREKGGGARGQEGRRKGAKEKE